MKKVVISTIAAVSLLALGAPLAGAAPGGAPGVHGVDGKTFGKLVSGLAKSDPGALVDHVSGR